MSKLKMIKIINQYIMSINIQIKQKPKKFRKNIANSITPYLSTT